MIKPQNFLIAGAGIAGLACALALAGQGHHVQVFEQADEIAEVGAGIQIGPNAVRALRTLGAWTHLEPLTVAQPSIQIFNGSNANLLREIDLGTSFEQKYRAPYRVAHRGDLLNALLQVALDHPAIELTTGARLEHYTNTPDCILCHFSNGDENYAQALIAADGIRSAARAQMLGEDKVRLSGHTIYRALMPLSASHPENVCLWLCPGGHVVHYPVSAGKHLNIVAATNRGETGEGWTAKATSSQVLSAFDSAHDSVLATLRAASDWHKWAGADLQEMPQWSDGHMIVVGDAAHASLPYLAQGAAMALEDAVVLAHCCATTNDIPSAFAAFQARRAPRTTRVIRQSRRMGKAYHARGPVAALRNIAISALPGLANPARLDWLYDWTA